MPRPWLVSFVCLHCVAWLAPSTLHAQFEDASRTAQHSTFRGAQDPRGEFAVEGNFSQSTPQKITPSKQAGTASRKPGEANARPASPAGSLWTSFGALAILVVAILLFARAWKKHGPRLGGGIPPEAVEVLGKRHIDQRQSLHLVRLGSKILLLGSSPAGLRTLAEVTDPVDVDYLAGVCKQNDTDGTAAQTFRALFNRNLPERPAQRRRARTSAIPPERHNEANGSESFSQHDVPQHDMEEARG